MEQQEVKTEDKALEAEGFSVVDSKAFKACQWTACKDKDCNTDGPCQGHVIIIFHRGKKTPQVPGARWQYNDTSKETFDAMLAAKRPADSTGRFFAREIKEKKLHFKLDAA